MLNQAYRQDLPVRTYRQDEATLPANSGDLTGNGLPPNHQNHQNHQNPSIVSPAVSSGEVVPGDDVKASEGLVGGVFSEFWSIYPRKVGRRAAERAFAAAVKRVGGVTVVLDGVRRLRDNPNLPVNKSFIPHPFTWPNRDGWEDEPFPAPSQDWRSEAWDASKRAVESFADFDGQAALKAGVCCGVPLSVVCRSYANVSTGRDRVS